MGDHSVDIRTYDIKIYADMKNSADNLIFYIKTNNCEETNILEIKVKT